MNRVAELPVSKHKPARYSTRAYPNTAAPAHKPQNKPNTLMIAPGGPRDEDGRTASERDGRTREPDE